jgi:predicted nucleic acid-binding protein
MTALPGTLYLFDTSAMARLTEKHARAVVAGAIGAGTAACCVTLDLEAAFSGRNSAEIEKLRAVRRESFVHLPINAQIEERAMEVMVLLAKTGRHRSAGSFDVLTAAVAEYHRATVVHFDAGFEHIATVTGQPQRWIVDRRRRD